MDKNIEPRLKIEKKLVWVIFLPVLMAFIFFMYRNIIMAWVMLALWLVLFIAVIFYGEKTEDMVYEF